VNADSPELRDRPDGRGLRCAIAVARFNSRLTEPLLAGARAALAASGVDAASISVTWVPGAFELPLAAQAIARSRWADAIVCLGAVIRGDTPHFDHVCTQAASGILRVSLDHHVAIGFGVLTLESLEQALERTGGRFGNKGEEAALAALEMALLLRAGGRSA
jgi:6,7-dimethyl-8-ribityllumazine synthase